MCTVSHRPRSSVLNKLSDFANVFKAFMGCGYLVMPFAFKQSGLILGIMGLVIIAYITDHCCILIVKCKKVAIDKIVNTTYLNDDESEESTLLETRKLKQRRNLELAMTYGDLGQIALGPRWGSVIINTALIITQFSFCVDIFIFMGITIPRMFPASDHTNQTHNQTSSALLASTRQKHEGATDVFLLMLIPFPIVLLQTYVRNIRSLAPLSAIANACILIGFFSILGFIFRGIDFGNIHKVSFWNFSTFPIFFGQLVGAFEGIGTILPIEASMNENRGNYKKYLHGVIILMSVIFGSSGIFGYIHFGDDVEQLVSDNLAYGTLSVALQATFCVAVLLTYPLMIFPIVEIAENLLFKETEERRTLTEIFNEEHATLQRDRSGVQYGRVIPGVENSEDDQSIKHQESGEGHSSAHVNGSIDGSTRSDDADVVVQRPGRLCRCDMGWSTWKRNILRSILVCLSFGVAYAGRNYYAYITALAGSMGSSVLAFILPCIFHLIIQRDKLPAHIIAKDILLILFGIIAGIVGFATTLIKIIK